MNESQDLASLSTAEQATKWFLGSMNDGLFIINREPRPSNDDGPMEHEAGPTLVLPVHGLPTAYVDAIIDAHNAAITAQAAELTTEHKRAPVQGFSAGIPWEMHLRAYDAYCRKCGPQKALIDLEGRGCRGGFGVRELDEFIPGWRDELSKISKLEAELSTCKQALQVAEAQRDAAIANYESYCAMDRNHIRACELSMMEMKAERDAMRADQSAARFVRLLGICHKILWTDFGEPAVENDQTAEALSELCEFLFLDACAALSLDAQVQS